MKAKKSKLLVILTKLNSISWVDFIGVLLFGAISFTIAFFFLRKGEKVTITLKLSESDTLVDSAWELRSPLWYIDRIKPGLAQKNFKGENTIEVKDVYSYSASETQQVTYVTLEVQSIYDKNTNQYIFNGLPLLLGSYQVFEVEGVEIRGIVFRVGPQSQHEEEWVTVKGFLNPEINDRSALVRQSFTNGVRKYYADKILQGMVGYDSKGDSLVEVVEVKKNPAQRIFVLGDKVVNAPDPERVKVELTLKLKVETIKGLKIHKNDFPIQIGTDVWLDFKNVAVFFTITDILETESPL